MAIVELVLVAVRVEAPSVVALMALAREYAGAKLEVAVVSPRAVSLVMELVETAVIICWPMFIVIFMSKPIQTSSSNDDKSTCNTDGGGSRRSGK